MAEAGGVVAEGAVLEGEEDVDIPLLLLLSTLSFSSICFFFTSFCLSIVYCGYSTNNSYNIIFYG